MEYSAEFLSKFAAIDIHTHAEEPCCVDRDDGYNEFQAGMAKYFKNPAGVEGMLPTVQQTAAYYREFFIRHTGELVSQAPVGEIDSAGVVSVGGLDVFYYPLVLIDSQAGPVLGLLMLWGAALSVRAVWRDRSQAAAVLLTQATGIFLIW